MVVAMASPAPFPGTQFEWGWLLGTIGSKRILWYQRHGLSTALENPDFWKFLIPGVGLAPVGGFRVLITLFVIAIGPVNYFLLRRLKRLHLLLLTTPASAAVVTAAVVRLRDRGRRAGHAGAGAERDAHRPAGGAGRLLVAAVLLCGARAEPGADVSRRRGGDAA